MQRRAPDSPRTPSPAGRSRLRAFFLGILALAIVAGSVGNASAASFCVDMNSVGPAGPAAQIDIGSVRLIAGQLPATGAVVPISIDDVFPFGAPDGNMDWVIPWTEDNSGLGSYAKIKFDPAVHGNGVERVVIEASHTNFLEFAAIDEFGAMIGPWQQHTAGQGNLQNFVWNTIIGGPLIGTIIVRGSEIAVTRICIEDDMPPVTSDCIDIAGMPLGLVANQINIDGVLFNRAILPDGVTPVPVEIRDIFLAPGGDGINEVYVPWSQVAGGAMQHAFIHFPAAQFGKGPIKVEILGAHFNQLDLVARDATGAPVDFATHPGPQNAWQTLVLNSAAGIRRIDIIGAELGIQELCYELDPKVTTLDGCEDSVTLPLGGAAHLWTLSGVEFEGAFDPSSSPLPISVTDNLPGGAAPDGVTEFFYGWSYNVPGSRTAKIRFPVVPFLDGPSLVEVTCARSTTLDLVAYDAAGAVVGSQTVTAAPLDLETIVFSGANIRMIELIGDQFWVQEVCWEGPYEAITAVEDGSRPRFANLNAPSPNPFNPRTTVSFSLDVAGPVELDVIDLRGRRVKTLVQDQLQPGDHAFVWDGDDDQGRPVASGVYLMRLRAAGEVQVQRAALLK